MTERDDPLVEEWMEEFRRVPDEWKPVVEHVRTVVRMVGEDELAEEMGQHELVEEAGQEPGDSA